jgi:hypothetical protein
MSNGIKSLWIIFVALLLSAIIIFVYKPNETNLPSETFDPTQATTEMINRGQEIAKGYCQSCHRFPDPNLLSKDIWISQTLPAMGPLLGVFEYNGREYPYSKSEHTPAGYYPKYAMLSLDDWNALLNFYYHNAPDSLPVSTGHRKIEIDQLFFKPSVPNYTSQTPPTATAAKLDSKNKHIYVSDVDGSTLLIFDQELNLEQSLVQSETISDIEFLNPAAEPGPRNLLISYLGSLVPSDAPDGHLLETSYNPAPGPGSRPGLNIIIDDLVRPVETRHGDLNDDGYHDLLVSEFGHLKGSLFWLEGDSNGTFKASKNIILNNPGCIQSSILDYTNDGLTDIVALCTQANQSLYLFEGSGDGNFERRTLLEFSLTAGSSSFQLHDFNNDGYQDILYTSGDNADFSIAYKPYHGVYIYLNDGNDNFSKEWFYPMNGAYDARVADFNGDGLTDIAAISFFGDYLNRPEEGFLLFLSDSNPDDTITFTPYNIPETQNGRWIAMDVADWTGNGLDDILLSNYSLGPDVEPEQAQMDDVFKQGPLFLLLENMGTVEN